VGGPDTFAAHKGKIVGEPLGPIASAAYVRTHQFNTTEVQLVSRCMPLVFRHPTMLIKYM